MGSISKIELEENETDLSAPTGKESAAVASNHQYFVDMVQAAHARYTEEFNFADDTAPEDHSSENNDNTPR